MRIFSALRRLMPGGNKRQRRQEEAWLSDPLMHPDVQAMTERELADLPFGRSARRRADGQ